MNTLRKELQLSQRQLSMLIGVSQPLLALYERGLRSLPTKALLKLAKLQLLLQQAALQKKQPRIPQQKTLQTRMTKLLSDHQQRAAYTVMRLGRELERMQDRHGKLLQRLTVIRTLAKEAPPATREKSLLENMEQEVLSKILHCCPEKQALIRYRISLSNAWKEAAREAHENMKEEG